MKNLKNKIKLKYIIAGGIVAIIGIILFAIYSYNEHMEYIKNTNPELARAMTYEEVADGDEEVEGTNNCVQFDAFFLRDLNGDGYAESIRGTSKEIGSEDTLYMEGIKCPNSRVFKECQNNNKWRELLFANIIAKR